MSLKLIFKVRCKSYDANENILLYKNIIEKCKKHKS